MFWCSQLLPPAPALLRFVPSAANVWAVGCYCAGLLLAGPLASDFFLLELVGSRGGGFLGAVAIPLCDPILKELHRLPVVFQAQFKVLVIT